MPETRSSVLAQALQAAKKFGASPRETKALIAAGLVESNLQHAKYGSIGSGDRDSVGFLQQRPSQGWGSPGESIETDARQFLVNARKVNRGGFNGSAGQLAQAVQRSAFPERYDQRGGEAEKLIGSFRGGSLGGSGVGTDAEASSVPSLPDAAPTSLAPLLASLAEQQKPQSAGLAAPAHSAAAVMPQGAQAVQSSSPAPKADALGAALGALAARPGVSLPATPDGPGEGASGAPGGSGRGSSGGAQAALGWARSKIGFKETGNNAGGIASYANARFGMANQPWCAMFTSLASTKGGAPKSARTASVAEVLQKAQAGVGYQRGFINPGRAKAGDLITFGTRHIGMVEKVLGNGKIQMVAGNDSDGVQSRVVTVAGDTRIVRPKYGARK